MVDNQMYAIIKYTKKNFKNVDKNFFQKDTSQ